MGKFSPLLREKLGLANPTKTLVRLVVEAKREKGDYVVSQLREAGFSVDTSLISTILDKTYIPVAVPAELVPEIAKIEGVVMVHKSMPRAIGGLTTAKVPSPFSVMDELIGEVRIPAVEVPATAFLEALPNPVTPLKALGNLAIPFTGLNPLTNIKIFPTSETFKIVKGTVKTKEGEGITVAVLDTGSPRYTTQFISPAKAASLDEYTVLPEPPVDFQSHGSWCHNCVCGEPAPSPYGTIVGGAPKVDRSIHVKCLSTAGFGSTEGIIKAIDIAIHEGAQVLSLSLGGPAQGPSAGPDADLECKLVNNLSKLKTVFVIAAGNSGPGLFTCGTPGAALNAVTVGSVSIMDHYRPAYWSSRVQSDWYGKHRKEFERDLAKYGDMLIKPDTTSCLVEGTKVYANNAPINIEKIPFNRLVYSYSEDGLCKARVYRLIPKGEQKVFELRTSYHSVTATADHEFLVLSKEIIDFAVRLTSTGITKIKDAIREKGLQKVAEVLGMHTASLQRILRKERGIFYNKLKKIQELGIKIESDDYIVGNYIKYKWDIKWKKLKDIDKENDFAIVLDSLPNEEGIKSIRRGEQRIKLTKELCKFVGVFLGDGSINKDNTIQIAITENDKCRHKYKELLIKLFGKVSEGRYLRVYSKKAVDLTKTLGLYNGAKTKKIPEWVFKLPVDLKMCVIEGLIDADGHIYDNGYMQIDLSSKELIEDLKILLDTCGIPSSNIYSRTRSSKHLGYDTLTNAYNLGFRIRPRDKKHEGIWNNSILNKIPKGFTVEKITRIIPKGIKKVFDLSINPTHNFIANGFVVHNCGGGRASPEEKVDEVIWSGATGWFEGFYDGIKDGTAGMHGTSQATPTAAAIIACLFSDGIVSNDLDVKKYLRETSSEYIIPDPLNTEEDNKYIARYGKSGATGWGLMMLKRYKK